MYHCSIMSVPYIYPSQLANYIVRLSYFLYFVDTIGQAEYVNNFIQYKFDHFYVTNPTYWSEEEMESVKWEVGMELWYIFVPFSSHTSGSVGKWRHNKSSTKVLDS